jgi:hypothetical protein
MVAVNLTTRGATRKTFEFLRIADTPEGFRITQARAGARRSSSSSRNRVNAGWSSRTPATIFRSASSTGARATNSPRGSREPIGGKERSEEWHFTRSP